MAIGGGEEPGVEDEGPNRASPRLPRKGRPARLLGPRSRALGVVLYHPLAEVTPPNVTGVHRTSIRWDELAEYPEHPKREEFVCYLDWKRSFA